jgi:hypothetical protein
MATITLPGSYDEFCDLPEEIHSILARGSWMFEDFGEDTTLWHDPQPALRFATQMPSNSTLLLWWTHLVFGMPTCDPLSRRWHLERTSKSFSVAALDQA